MDLKIPAELVTVGNLEQNWLNWKQKFNNYLVATEKISKSDQIKIAIFLTLIGDDGIKIYNTLNKSDLVNLTSNEETLDNLLQQFEKKCMGKKNVVYERYCFLSYKRAADQLIDNYVVELKLKSRSCEYGDLTDSIIRDQVVLNVRNQSLQDRLISCSDLSLAQAVEMIQRAESAHEQVVQMNNPKTQEDDASINLVKRVFQKGDKKYSSYGNRRHR